MGQHTYLKRQSSADRQPADVSAPEGLHYPNSALAAMTGADSPSGNNLADIHDSIMQRFSPAVRESIQAQIPTAEAEADRLSASVKSGSPDAVKAAMGRKMGADFSGVRFHTGKAAEAKASAVDARAYTSGNDVYFGEGGFDPAIAAHELVHTAQQGVVTAATPTVATPVGGVQRWNPFKKKSSSGNAQPAPAPAAPAQVRDPFSMSDMKAALTRDKMHKADASMQELFQRANHGGTAADRALAEQTFSEWHQGEQVRPLAKQSYTPQNMSTVLSFTRPILQREIAQASRGKEATDGNRFVFARGENIGMRPYVEMLANAGQRSSDQMFDYMFTPQGPLPDISSSAAYAKARDEANPAELVQYEQQALTDFHQYLDILGQDQNAMDALRQSADMYSSLGTYHRSTGEDDPVQENLAGMLGGREEALQRALSDMMLRSFSPAMTNTDRVSNYPNQADKNQATQRTATMMRMQSRVLAMTTGGRADSDYSDQQKAARAGMLAFFQQHGLIDAPAPAGRPRAQSSASPRTVPPSAARPPLRRTQSSASLRAAPMAAPTPAPTPAPEPASAPAPAPAPAGRPRAQSNASLRTAPSAARPSLRRTQSSASLRAAPMAAPTPAPTPAPEPASAPAPAPAPAPAAPSQRQWVSARPAPAAPGAQLVNPPPAPAPAAPSQRQWVSARPAPAAPRAQLVNPPPGPGSKTTKDTMLYRSDRIGQMAAAPLVDFDPTTSDPEQLALFARHLYDKIQNPSQEDSEEDISKRKQMFAAVRARQMKGEYDAQQRAAAPPPAPAPAKKKHGWFHRKKK